MQERIPRWASMALAVVMVTIFAAGFRVWQQDQMVIAPSEAVPQVEVLSSIPVTSGEDAAQPSRETIVYYQDTFGLLVPVMLKVPAKDGIAKETLNCMIKTPENDMNAAKLGLKTTLPEGLTFDIDIANGVARVDLSAQANKLADSKAEENMINAIVQALTEFPTVKKVSFLIAGQALNKLKNGTTIEKEYTRAALNIEDDAAQTSSGGSWQQIRLYFPEEYGAVLVPVTRMVQGVADVHTAVLELAKGPGKNKNLVRVLPEECGIIGVQLKNGVATINFSKEFVSIAEQTDGGREALKALVLTATQFPNVKEVKIEVEGKPYDPGASTLTVPTFANEITSATEVFGPSLPSSSLELAWE